MDFKRRNIDLKLDFKGQDLITAPMHPSEWTTILQNLYSNAKKAIIRSNVARGNILVKASKDMEKNEIAFEFQDNGNGIPQKYKDRIFDAFFSTSSQRNDDLGTNTGLGLYILYQMIHNRGGKISVEDPEEGYKTNIRISLPLATINDLRNHGF